ncbi:MAG: nucleoside hydrolase [Chloroflexota bacterium]
MIRVIMDVDTGIDDALALALAVLHPDIRLEAVLTVAGNVALTHTPRNTIRVLDWLGEGALPVFAGESGPLHGPSYDAGEFHGPDGLGNASLPEPSRIVPSGAPAKLVELLRAQPGQYVLVCTAPLTNIAHALRIDPGIVALVQRVVLMGGAVCPPGNVTAVAEFNIFADPHAAAAVFAQPWPITMVGLDVTNQVRLSRADWDALRDDSGPAAVLTREVSRYVFEVSGRARLSLHDPLAVAVAIDPSLVTTARGAVAVETAGEHTRGLTIFDLRPTASPGRSHTEVCLGVDAARFRRLFAQTLGLALAI